MSYDKKEKAAEALLNFAIKNLFFYRAKSITFDVSDFRPAKILLLKCDPVYFPHLDGKVLRLNDMIEANTVYDSSKILIEQYTTPARPDIEKRMPFTIDFNYIGLMLNVQSNVPCPIMVSCIKTSGSNFYLQFTAQNLELQLDVLRKELDKWHAENQNVSFKLDPKNNYVI